MTYIIPLRILTKWDLWFGRLYLSMLFSGLFWGVGIILHFKKPNTLATFFITALSLVPISILIQMSSGDILVRLRKARVEFFGGVFRTIFGSFAELSLATIALLKHDALLAQTSLTGAFLVNALLVIGLSFVANGVTSEAIQYPLVIARVSSQLLVVSLVSLVLPTAFQLWQNQASESDLQATSRSAAVTLFILFICYLIFFYKTHAQHTSLNARRTHKSVKLMLSHSNVTLAAPSLASSSHFEQLLNLRDKSLKSPHLPVAGSISTLAVSCCLCMASSFFVVSSKGAPTDILGISKSFVGLVLVPLLLSAPEQIESVFSSKEEIVEWVIEEAIATCIRIALFILPVLVLLGWMLGVEDMTLFFDGFQVTLITLTIILVNYLLHGHATWIEGIILICTYILYAIAAWYYPG